jgi:hypothetical protein
MAMNWHRDNLTHTVLVKRRANGYQTEALLRLELLYDPQLLLILLPIGVATAFVLGGVLIQIPRRMTDPDADELGAMDA